MAKLSSPSAQAGTPSAFDAPDDMAAATATVQGALSQLAQAAAQQSYPRGALYVVATPIGNRADFSVRALHVLALVDAIACEDTRHTRQLLSACGLERPGIPLLALHQHNEAEGAGTVIGRLQRGERVAYVSDAGTPAVSDPGARLVAAVQAAGLRAIPLPGASSVTTALSVAGIVEHGALAEGQGRGFVFWGFLPTRPGERKTALKNAANEGRAVVFLESPHRIAALADELASLGERSVTVARELSKQFEQVACLPAAQLSEWLTQDSSRQRGEFVLILHPAVQNRADDDTLRDMLRLLLTEVSTKSAASLASQLTNTPRKRAYELALQLREAESPAPNR